LGLLFRQRRGELGNQFLQTATTITSIVLLMGRVKKKVQVFDVIVQEGARFGHTFGGRVPRSASRALVVVIVAVVRDDHGGRFYWLLSGFCERVRRSLLI